MKTLFVLAGRTWEQFGADNCSQMAAAVTYYVLFAVVPLTMFIVSVVGVVASDEDQRQEMTQRIEEYLDVVPANTNVALEPGAVAGIEGRYESEATARIEEELVGVNESASPEDKERIAEMVEAGEPVTVAGYELRPDEVAVQSDDLIADTLQGVSSASTTLGIIGFVTLALSATVAFGAIRRSLNVVWDVEYRPFFQQRLVELTMLIVLVLLLAASIAATAAAQVLRELNDGQQNPVTGSGFAWSAFGYFMPWALTSLLVLLAYRFVPNAQNRFRDVWPGALVAATGIELLKYGYGVYVANFGNYGVIYGALGGILLFMFFAYIASYLFLMGAELASEYPRVLRGDYATEGEDEPERPLVESVLRAIRGLFIRG